MGRCSVLWVWYDDWTAGSHSSHLASPALPSLLWCWLVAGAHAAVAQHLYRQAAACACRGWMHFCHKHGWMACMYWCMTMVWPVPPVLHGPSFAQRNEGRGWAILILDEREVWEGARAGQDDRRLNTLRPRLSLRLDETGSAALRASPAEPRPSQRMHCWAQAAGCRRTRVLQGVAAVLLQPSLKKKQ